MLICVLVSTIKHVSVGGGVPTGSLSQLNRTDLLFLLFVQFELFL